MILLKRSGRQASSAAAAAISKLTPKRRTTKERKSKNNNVVQPKRKSPRSRTIQDTLRSIQKAKGVKAEQVVPPKTRSRTTANVTSTSVLRSKGPLKPKLPPKCKEITTRKRGRPSKRDSNADTLSKIKEKDDNNKKKKTVQQEYIVEEIVGHQNAAEINFCGSNQVWNYSTDVLAFRVKWQDYDESENTWEPLENLKSCGKFVAYLNKYLIPTIGKQTAEDDISFEYIEPVEHECYYLDHLHSSVEEHPLEDLDETVVDHDADYVQPPESKKHKQAAKRSPKIVAKPKKPKKDAETQAATEKLRSMLNGTFDFNFESLAADTEPEPSRDLFGGAPPVDQLYVGDDIYYADTFPDDYAAPQIPVKDNRTRSGRNRQNAPAKKKHSPERIVAVQTPRLMTRSLKKAADIAAAASSAPLDLTEEDKATVPQPTTTGDIDMNSAPEEPVNDENDDPLYQVTYDCIDGTPLEVGRFYTNEMGKHLHYNGEHLVEVDPSQVYYVDEAGMLNFVYPSDLPSSSSIANGEGVEYVYSNDASEKDQLGEFDVNQYYRDSQQDDPMLMAPQSYGDFAFNNSFTVPTSSVNRPNVKEIEPPKESFLAENLEDDLNFSFNFDSSSNPNSSMFNPFSRTPNPNRFADANESTLSNPFRLFGHENALSLMQSSIIAEEFLDEVQNDI